MCFITLLFNLFAVMGFQTPLDLIKKEEEEFNLQYEQWRKQYDDWREQNKCKQYCIYFFLKQVSLGNIHEKNFHIILSIFKSFTTVRQTSLGAKNLSC